MSALPDVFDARIMWIGAFSLGKDNLELKWKFLMIATHVLRIFCVIFVSCS